MTKVLEVSEENLDDLLAYDDTFLDYFNAFLSSSAFPVPLYYDRLTGTIHEVDVDTSASVEDQPAKYGPSDEERERVFSWVKNDRLPLFLASRFYLEYKLSKHLVRTLEIRRASTYSMLGGYSRQTRSESTSTFMNSASKNSTVESNDYDEESNAWPEIRYSAFKYLRPGSRAFSLPISFMRSRKAEKEFYISDDESDGSPAQTGRNVQNVSGVDKKNGEPKSILKSGAKVNKKSVQLSSTDKDPDSSKKTETENEIEVLHLPSTGNNSKRRPTEKEDFYYDIDGEDYKYEDLAAESEVENFDDDEVDVDNLRSGKSSVFEKSASNINNRLLTGKLKKIPTESSQADLTKETSSRTRRRTTAHKRRTVLQQLKEEYLTTKEGLESFKRFLTTTENGKDLIEFWVEVEQFKDELEQFEEFGEEGISGKQFRQAFREIMNKYNLSRETKDQIRKLMQNDGFSVTVFMRTQYDILRRIRTYWVPRYLEHMEQTEGIRVPSAFRSFSMETKSKPSSTAGVTTVTDAQSLMDPTDHDLNEYEESKDDTIPDKLQDFSLHPHLDISNTLPLKPDDKEVLQLLNNPFKTWSDVQRLNKSQVSRVKSGIKRTPEEWKVALQPQEDFFRKSIESDKLSGGPFFRYLQKQCLSSNSELEKHNMKNVAKFLFWQDAQNYETTADLYSNQQIKHVLAWNIFNKYFNPLSVWFIEIAHKDIENMRMKLQHKIENLKSTLFKPIAESIIKDLEKPWVGYNKEDLETFLAWRGHSGNQLLTRFTSASGISFDDDDLKIRRYPGSTESQIRQRLLREKILKEEELERLEEERRRLLSEKRNRILQERKMYLHRQRRMLHEQQSEEIAASLVQFSRPTRTRDSENRRALENQWKKKASKKQKDKSAQIEVLTLDSILTDETLCGQFRNYLSECEKPDAWHKVTLLKDLETHFKLQGEEKEKSGMNIVSNYMRRDAPCRVELVRKLIIRELKPPDQKLTPVLESVELEVGEMVDIFKQGMQFLAKLEAGKKSKGDSQKINTVPPMWNKRKMENGLIEDDGGVPPRLNPTPEDKEMLKLALDSPQEEKMLSMLHNFYRHLQRCVKSGDCHGLLPKGLLFCFEVSRLQELIHKNNDPPSLARKIEAILEVFLESLIEPKIQLDIPVDLVVRICKQGHFFAKNEQYSEISGFTDAYERIFKQLCPYFAAFHKFYKPSKLAEKNPEKNKMLRLMDLEVQKRHEEWRARCATPKLVYKLPKLPVRLKQNVKGVQVSFSFQEGIRCKALDSFQMQHQHHPMGEHHVISEEMRRDSLIIR